MSATAVEKQLATELLILRHHQDVAMQGSIKALLDFLVPNLFVEPKHASSQFPEVSAGFYCDPCQSYIGKYFDKACSICGRKSDLAKSIENGHFFFFTPLKELLKYVLQNHKDLLQKKSTDKHHVKDVMDGKMYQDLLKQKKMAQEDLTLTWNFDEVPISRSTPKYSIWPLQFIINELPFTYRKENVMVAGFWFGKDRPKMDIFLKPFIDESCDLAENPLEWTDSEGTVHSSRVFSLVCSSDAVARPILRNCTQFNGEYGCDWCLHPGTMVRKGEGSVRSYMYDKSIQTARSKEEFEKDAEDSNAGSPRNGVKGASPLLTLPLFDIVFGFVPDYMHSVVLGVTKQLLSLWLNSDNSDKGWYVGQDMSKMDSQLKRLKPPFEMSRPTNSLQFLNLWNASQLRDFLLFYGIRVLQDSLHPVYLKHYLYLSFSLHILLQESVSEDDLQLAHRCLVKFVIDMKEHYGEENVSFNCHQLIHLTDSVRNWGPLWATSAFGFERNSGHLKALLRGTDYSPQHIHQMFQIWQHIPRHIDSFIFNQTHNFGELLAKLSPGKDGSSVQRQMEESDKLDLTEAEKTKFRVFLKRPVLFSSVEAFHSFTHQNTVYDCGGLENSNCTVKLKNGSFGEIKKLFFLKEICFCKSGSCLCKPTPIIDVHLYDVKPHPLFSEICPDKPVFMKAERKHDSKLFHMEDIACKCINMEEWLVSLPNTCEKY